MGFDVSVFKGIDSSKSPLVMDKENAIDISNLRIDNPAGALSSNLLGNEKWHSLGVGNPIQAIFQLQKHGYTSVEDTLFYLAKNGTTARWFFGKMNWYYINEYLTFGSYGSGDDQFNLSGNMAGIKYDDGYVYVTDYNNHRVVRCKMDGSEFDTIGTFHLAPFSSGEMRYPMTLTIVGDYPYICCSNTYLIKTEKDMSGVTWDVTNLSSVIAAIKGVCYDSVNEKLVYVGTSYTMARSNLDGSSPEAWSFFTVLSIAFAATCVVFDPDTEFYYVGASSGGSNLLIKTKWNGAEYSTRYCNLGRAVNGIARDSNTGLIYIGNTSGGASTAWVSVLDYDDATSDVNYSQFGVTTPVYFSTAFNGSGPLGIDISDGVLYIANQDGTTNTLDRIIAVWKDYLTA